ncbi:hypothetical protein BH10BAC2_BH10BAC2_45430 [soil metagenome]
MFLKYLHPVVDNKIIINCVKLKWNSYGNNTLKRVFSALLYLLLLSKMKVQVCDATTVKEKSKSRLHKNIFNYF